MSNTTQIVSLGGHNIVTTVADTAAEIDAWVAEITSFYVAGGRKTLVGLDVEWRPNVISTLSNKSATLQLCIKKKCLIIQLFYLDYIPQSLKNFLGRPNFTFVGVQVHEDGEKLKDEYGLVCSKFGDIQGRAMDLWPDWWYRRPGLKTLAQKRVGLNMAKPMNVCRSDWQARVLSKEQVEYACIDAFASYKIGKKLFMNL